MSKMISDAVESIDKWYQKVIYVVKIEVVSYVRMYSIDVCVGRYFQFTVPVHSSP